MVATDRRHRAALAERACAGSAELVEEAPESLPAPSRAQEIRRFRPRGGERRSHRKEIGDAQRPQREIHDEPARNDRHGHGAQIVGEGEPQGSPDGHTERNADDDADDCQRGCLPRHRRGDLAPDEPDHFQ